MDRNSTGSNGFISPRETLLERALKQLTHEVITLGRKPEAVRGTPLPCHQCGRDTRQVNWVLYAHREGCHLFCCRDCLKDWLRAQELLYTEWVNDMEGFDSR
jgi:hypothetical protein